MRKIPSSWLGCYGKIKYKSYHEAQRSISRKKPSGVRRHIRHKGADKIAGKIGVYKCGLCNFWHTGKNKYHNPRLKHEDY